MATTNAPRCPYCGQEMKKWKVPLNSTWPHDFFYVCFNNNCPYFVQGWKHIQDHQQIKTSYRCRLDPDSDYARRYPDQIPADGERIPTLDEVIALLRSHPDGKTQLWIEIKTSPENSSVSSMPEAVAEKVVSLLLREKLIHRSKVLSFDWRSLVHVQKIAPDVQTVYLSTTSAHFDTIQKGRSGASPWTAGLDVDDFGGSIPRIINALGGRYWAPRYNQISSARLKEAHRLNLDVFVWTVDSRTEMVRLVEMGVDGIITNSPDVLMEERR